MIVAKVINILLVVFLAIQFSSTIDSKNQQFRTSSAPYISGDSFRAIADHIFDETQWPSRYEVKQGDIIFVKTDYLDRFFSQVHSNIKNQYILITHNSDYSAPDKFEPFLDDEKIIVWFGQNPTIQGHRKFVAIPIGIANQCWPHGDVTHFDTVIKGSLHAERKYLLGINFRPTTNKDARMYVYEMFNHISWCKNIENFNHIKYLKNMTQAKFVLSPAGNGLDCHRTWETLLVGAFPVVKSSCLDELLVGLPVVIIDDWRNISSDFLNDVYDYMICHIDQYCYEKLYFDYWKTLIYKYKNHDT